MEPVVEIEAPLTQTAWSPDFVVQSIEVLFVYRGDTGIRSLRPVHADSLQLGLGPGTTASDVVLAAAARYGLRPVVVHSTSWRQADARVVLTYLAVVERPAEPSRHLVDEAAAHRELARGDATAAPARIAAGQVLEHALRHLAWLLRDDDAVRAALPDWQAVLTAYVPEPFRGL
ncbi:MAG: hypothetical protein L0221_17400 [Chloroflexi bacterium]|nr:hypothetical protein [Chloroflexota bacterium]